MTFTDTSSHFPLAPGTMLRWFRSPLSSCVPFLPPKLQSLLPPCRAEARSQPCLHSCLHICEVSWGSPGQALARGHPSQRCLSLRKGLQKGKSGANQKPAMASWRCSQRLVAAVASTASHRDAKKSSFPWERFKYNTY